MALIEIKSVVDGRRLPATTVLELVGRAVTGLAVGDHLEVITADPASTADVAAWCVATGHALVDQSGDGATYALVIGRQ